MRESLHAICLGLLICGITVSIGCAPAAPRPTPPSTPVSISSFQDAAGKWAGILKTTPRSRQDDWVTLVIREDGSYRFESVRTIGIMQGQGTFTLTDGQIRAENEKGGWGVATLYKDDGRRMLKLEGVTKDSTPYSAELHPAK